VGARRALRALWAQVCAAGTGRCCKRWPHTHLELAGWDCRCWRQKPALPLPTSHRGFGNVFSEISFPKPQMQRACAVVCGTRACPSLRLAAHTPAVHGATVTGDRRAPAPVLRCRSCPQRQPAAGRTRMLSGLAPARCMRVA
jgi:hypothetical protein